MRKTCFLTAAGLPVMSSDTHIVPLFVGDPEKCKQASDLLLEEHGIYIQPINYPTVPKGGERMRLTPAPYHTDAHIDALVAALEPLMRDPAAAQAMGERARARVLEKFSLDAEAAHELTIDMLSRAQGTPLEWAWCSPRVRDPVTLALKRVLDIVASFLGLVLSLPLSLVAALLGSSFDAVRGKGRHPELVRARWA